MTIRCKSLDQLALWRPKLRPVHVGRLPALRWPRSWPPVAWSPTRLRHHFRHCLYPVSQFGADRAVNSYWRACSSFVWVHICLQRLPAGPLVPEIPANLWLSQQSTQIYQQGSGQNPGSYLSFFSEEKVSRLADHGLHASCLEMRRPHGPAATCFCSSQPSAKSAHCSCLAQPCWDPCQQYCCAASNPSHTTARTISFADTSSPIHKPLVLASAFHSAYRPS